MVVDRQVQIDALLAVELVKVVQRLEELGHGAVVGVVGGEGVMGRNRCILQHKSGSSAQDCAP